MDLAPPPADAARAPAPPPLQDDGGPERIFGGVAALLADRLDIDALWIRIAFVLLALVGGVGVLVYGAMWLVFIVGDDPDRWWARVAGGAVLVGGLPLLLTTGFSFLDGPFAVLALLIGLAVALWQPRRPLRSAPALLSPPGGAAAATTVGADDPAGPAGTEPAWRRLPRLPRRPRRPPSILGRLTFGIAVVVAAVGALIDQANGGRLHPEQWLGAAAIVCGYGLLVGAIAGRALWLIVPAALFAGTGFAAGEAARVGVEPSALIGDEHVFVDHDTPGGSRREEHVVIGNVDVSINGAPSAPVSVDARAGIGEVRIWAADDVTVEVRADADHGHVDVSGRRRPDGTFTIGPEGAPDVVVVARVGRGHIYVDDYGPVREAPVVGGRQYVAEGVLLADGGRFVLGNGEAVIDADDTVLTGSTVVIDRVTVIATSFGEFQLLPGGLLLTPYGELLDLSAVRGDSSGPGAATTVAPVPSVPTVPTVPTVTGG